MMMNVFLNLRTTEHTNYIGVDETGLFIISVEGPGLPGMQSATFASPREGLHSSSSNLSEWESRPLRVLVRSYDGTKRGVITGSKKKKKKLRELYPNLPSKLSKVIVSIFVNYGI